MINPSAPAPDLGVGAVSRPRFDFHRQPSKVNTAPTPTAPELTVQITLLPTDQTGRWFIETGDRATSGERTWIRYEVVGIETCTLHGRSYRLDGVYVDNTGDVSVWLAQQTKTGRDFKNGTGMWESLATLTEHAPELAAAIRAELPAEQSAADTLAERYPIGAEVRQTRTGRRAWVVGTEYSPRDGVEVVQIDYRDGSAPAASSAEFTELVIDETPAPTFQLGDVVRSKTSRDRIVVEIQTYDYLDRYTQQRRAEVDWTDEGWERELHLINVRRSHVDRWGPRISTRAMRDGLPYGPVRPHRPEELTLVASAEFTVFGDTAPAPASDRTVELTDLLDDSNTATVPLDQIAATIRGWYSPNLADIDCSGCAAIATADLEKAEELQRALIADDLVSAAEIAGEIGVGYDLNPV